jgi:N6-L-threonylcarbamoyladenine synthase
MTELVLGIETSCDDTAVAIVDEKGNVLSSVIASQVEVHEQFGGVYPEFAGRAHIASVIPTVEKAFSLAQVTHKDIRAIGVTRGPGLIGSLLVGLNTAAGLGIGWNKQVIGINHLRGHLRSADLEEQRVKYPAIILLVSGGHTFLAYMKDPLNISLLGSTRDDSVGEAYDKVGRMLGLGYPGGPAVDRMAMKGQNVIPFPKPMIHDGLEFSLSGLKSAVSRYIANTESPVFEDIAASFVQTIMDILITKCKKAILKNPCVSLVIVGGVAASPQLRAEAKKLCDSVGIELCLPPVRWSTDNAAMIALATWDYLNLGILPKPIPQLQLPISDF